MTDSRSRAAKACSSCRSRKVRCDVLRVGIPCTSCRTQDFDCGIAERKRRRRKGDATLASSRTGHMQMPSHLHLPRPMPEHVMLHQVPHYPFFRNFNPRGRPWLHAQDKERGVLLPVPARDQSAASQAGHSNGRAEDFHFLEQKGALQLPSKAVLDGCIITYFRYFHPFFPIIDKTSFLRHYRQQDHESILRGQGPSLLLLQAIIFTAISTIPMKDVLEMGFASRKDARSTVHTRATYLHSLDYESDDIVLIQALLLLSHYYPSMVEQRHTWFWVHQAIGLAQGVGLHRHPGDVPQRKIWARIWWGCLSRDRLIALGTGRPMHINSLDCNVPLLTLADLEEDGDEDEDRSVKAIFIEFLRLCQYMEGVLSLPLVAADSQQEQLGLCETALGHWATSLAPVAQRMGDGSEGSVSMLYRSLLHLLYNVVLLSLRHYDRALSNNQTESSKMPSLDVQATAADSVHLLAQITDFGLVRFLPTQSVTTILPPLIVQLLLMRYSDNPPDYEAARARFQVCMACLEDLGKIYWHAGFYHDFFEMAAANQTRPQPSGNTSGNVPRMARSGTTTLSTGAAIPSHHSREAREPRIHDDESDKDGHVQHKDQDKALISYATPSIHDVGSDLHLSQSMTSFFNNPYPLHDTGNLEVLGADDRLYEAWLDADALFQNLFPSA